MRHAKLSWKWFEPLSQKPDLRTRLLAPASISPVGRSFHKSMTLHILCDYQVRAWMPARQPIYHPNDEDLSLGW
jgi:hypothetical protein